jgi:glutathione S-transferase
MAERVTFYHNPMSRGRIVHWMLEEVGAPYDVKLIDLQKKEHKAPAYLKINPMGKVPAIEHRGTVVTETAAIIAYLADAFPKAGLAPALDDPKRGTYYRWMFFGAGCLEPALVDRMMERPKVERTTALAYGTYEDTLNALEAALEPGPYILGDNFSAVDLYIGAQIGWGMFTKALEPRPAFQQYLQRFASRPAYKKVNG